jgi:hypothetical protein
MVDVAATRESVEAACLAYWPLHWESHMDQTDKESIRRHMASAVEAAVRAERDRCALICRAAAKPNNHAGVVVAMNIERAILNGEME